MFRTLFKKRWIFLFPLLIIFAGSFPFQSFCQVQTKQVVQAHSCCCKKACRCGPAFSGENCCSSKKAAKDTDIAIQGTIKPNDLKYFAVQPFISLPSIDPSLKSFSLHLNFHHPFPDHALYLKTHVFLC